MCTISNDERVITDAENISIQKEREIALKFPLRYIVTNGVVEGKIIGYKIDSNGQPMLYIDNGESHFYIYADKCEFSDITREFPFGANVTYKNNSLDYSGIVIGYKWNGDMWILMVQDQQRISTLELVYEYPPKKWRVMHRPDDKSGVSENPFNKIKGADNLEHIFSKNGKTE
ncbi:MAG: hypothetical protein ABIH55_01550 [Nanoarchaeota archaeon]|nr:hypothetical protein [Nanoarchaeota archaeon]MBU1135494.1 hypothetical protein [Nanoarchaeota archaeon]